MRRMPKGVALTAGFGGALSLCISLATAQSPPISERKSGFEFMSPESQATQQDDFSNPGMLWVAEGETLWNVKAGVHRALLRRVSRGCGREHERRCRALSCLFRRERTTD